jgi:hypothetical protein
MPGLAAARDDHLIAQLVEGLGQRPANAGAAAGDENGIAGHAHGEISLFGCVGQRYA